MQSLSHQKRLASAVLMVRPEDFRFNEQTGKDNAFQKAPSCPQSEVNSRAMAEFKAMVARLREAGVEVLVLEKNPSLGVETPDAVFPNNWFSTEHDGTLIFYPMLTENRRAEKRIVDVEALLDNNGFHIRNLINIGRYGAPRHILEGTGSMIIDHRGERVYAAESQRCEPVQFDNFIHARRYKEGILFRTADADGLPIYHTNVMMSIGMGFAVICAECIVPADRARVLGKLRQTHEVIEISMAQMAESFCGNILQISNTDGEPLIAMSASAHAGFTQEQRDRLEQHGRLLPLDITTIEEVGGGSVRCMLAEVFLPRQPQWAERTA